MIAAEIGPVLNLCRYPLPLPFEAAMRNLVVLWVHFSLKGKSTTSLKCLALL